MAPCSEVTPAIMQAAYWCPGAVRCERLQRLWFEIFTWPYTLNAKIVWRSLKSDWMDESVIMDTFWPLYLQWGQTHSVSLQLSNLHIFFHFFLQICFFNGKNIFSFNFGTWIDISITFMNICYFIVVLCVLNTFQTRVLFFSICIYFSIKIHVFFYLSVL